MAAASSSARADVLERRPLLASPDGELEHDSRDHGTERRSRHACGQQALAELDLGARVNRWQVSPSGTEGYRTAEVTLGGVDVDELSSKTMEAKAQPGLYFIGEVVDVTGHLGGYNFQWAWSSGFVAGEAV